MKIKILLIWVVALSSFSLLSARDDDYVEKRLQVYGTDSVYLVTVKLPADSAQAPQYRMDMLDTKGNILLPPVYHNIDKRDPKPFFDDGMDKFVNSVSEIGYYLPDWQGLHEP